MHRNLLSIFSYYSDFMIHTTSLYFILSFKSFFYIINLFKQLLINCYFRILFDRNSFSTTFTSYGAFTSAYSLTTYRKASLSARFLPQFFAWTFRSSWAILRFFITWLRVISWIGLATFTLADSSRAILADWPVWASRRGVSRSWELGCSHATGWSFLFAH